MQADQSSVQLVLFDLDGTLADTFKDLFWALNESLREHGYAHAQSAKIRPLVSQGGRAMARAALPAQFKDSDARLEQVHQRFLELYAQHIATRTTLFAGMPQVLQALGHADIGFGVVTNKLSHFSEPLLAHLQLFEQLRCLVCGDTAARAKPHPDPLQLAARLAKVPIERCVYVGDAHNDVLAAQAAGMRVMVATWGYLGSDDDPDSWNAEALVDDPLQLIDLLL
jgi:2-phosphoglycolate phosphatase